MFIRKVTARRRLVVCVVAGVLAGVLTALFGSWAVAPLVGWDVAALIYLGGIWAVIWPLDPASTAREAAREDETRASADLLLLGAAVASLAAVGGVILRAGHLSGWTRMVLVGLGVASVVLSWSVVHTVYTLRYARLYYGGTAPGGVNFKESEPPGYTDFAYLAFTIGMTFQVSDTDLGTRQFRATALRHALLSYLFGTVIVATTINLLVNLSK